MNFAMIAKALGPALKVLGPVASKLGSALISLMLRTATEKFLAQVAYRFLKTKADEYAAAKDAAVVVALATKDPVDDGTARAEQARARQYQAVVSDLAKTWGLK